MKQTMIALLVMAAFAPALRSQVLYGSVVGSVTDSSGAVVPHAAVTITNVSAGVVRETKTDTGGRYSVANVLAGEYELKVEAPGFRTFRSTGLNVTINSVARADVQLEVGAISQEVTVAASAVLLQTDKSDTRTEINNAALVNLPLPGYRNYQSLINLVPGATPAGFQNAVVDTPARALTTNINGTARNNNNTLVDGAVNTFIWLPHHTVYVQPVESIETVNVTTGSFDAEQGMAGGAAITVSTKSGSNHIRGSAFWFHDNQHFRSPAFIKSGTYVQPVEINNQGGATVGGPIRKDKLFYFGSIERTWERNGVFGNYSVAPADWRRGDFSQWTDYATIYDPTTAVGTNVSTRQPFPGNIIPQNRINPIFNRLQNLTPLPNQKAPTDPLGLGGTYGASGSQKLDRTNYDLKVNWNTNPKLVIWGKYSRMDAFVTGVYVFGDLGGPAMGTDGFGDTNVNIPTAGFTYTFNSTFLMDGVFGYTRFDQTVGIPGQDTNTGLDVWGIPGTNGGRQYANDRRYGGLPNITGFGFENWGVAATWAPLFRNDRSYTYTTNFSKIMGSHELRWGFEPRRHAMNHWQPETANPRGSISIAGGATRIPGRQGRSPHSYAAGLLGLVGSYSKSIQFLDMKTREWQLAWYFRDRWQVNRRFTVNLGVRYENYPLIGRGDRGIERWDPYTNLVYLGGLGDVPRNAGITVSNKLFAPRVGLAYRLGDAWVVRSGFGLTYDPLPFSRPLRGLYPATLTGSWGAGNPEAAFQEPNYGWFNRLDQGIPDIPTPDITKGVLTLPLNVNMGPRSPWGGYLKRGYIMSWNATVQRRLPGQIVTSAAYVATRTVGQLLDRNINVAGPGTTNTRDLPLAKLYGRTIGASMWDGIGRGSYHSLQMTLDRAFRNGLFLKGSYTFSKTLNMGEDSGWAGLEGGWNWEPMINRNYAPANYDRRHMFVMSWMYGPPIGKGKKLSLGPLNAIFGNWLINGVFNMYSGTPFWITTSGDSLRCFGCTQTADLIAPVRKIDKERGPGKPYYDPSSFADPLWSFDPANPVYRHGTTGRNFLRGPGFWRLDPMVSKKFRVREGMEAELRWEAQNVTNTPRWGNPSAGMGSIQRDAAGNVTDYRNFMSISGAGSLRVMRLGARLQF